MDKIQTYVQFFLKEVELNICVGDKLERQEKQLKNFGYIQITDVGLNTKPIFWDGIEFFLSCTKAEFKKECKKELKLAGYDWKECFEIIQLLLKRALELNLLHTH